MGVVYRARDQRTDATVALKILDRDSEALRARFERESTVLRGLDHPRIVRYLDHGATSDGSPYLVMEWLSGLDLAARVAQGRLDVGDAINVAIGAAEGLAAAHAAGVVRCTTGSAMHSSARSPRLPATRGLRAWRRPGPTPTVRSPA